LFIGDKAKLNAANSPMIFVENQLTKISFNPQTFNNQLLIQLFR